MPVIGRAKKAIADTKQGINAALVTGIIALAVAILALALAIRK